MMQMNQLETARLLLRPYTENDFAAVHAYASDPFNVRYMTFPPNDEAGTRRFLAETMRKAEIIPRLAYDFAVVRKDTGAMIGGCELYLEADQQQGSLGWILHRDHWKQGFGTELANALIRLGFEGLHLGRIEATCHAENYGSYRVMERNGLRREGLFPREGGGEEWHYAILAEEWRGFANL
jgi:RimJ/RimL family protein N-acetyltransferase